MGRAAGDKQLPAAATGLASAVSSNFTISVKTLTPSITANNKVYDATTNATIATRSLSGVVGGDDVTLTGGTASFATKTVGTNKTVTATGLALSGTTAGNYVLSSTTATTTANITSAALSVINVSANNKVYDRTTTATLSGTAALSGVISGDTVALGGTPSASFADKSVGTNKPVTVTGYTISGADAGNYLLSQPAGLTANITRAGLTVSGITANDRVYNGTTNASLNLGGATLNGVISGDSVTLNTGSATGAFTSKTVGTNKTVNVSSLTVSGADASNYSLTQPTTTASISAANLTVTGITASDRVYDATTNATLNTAGAALVGVVSGDSVTLNTASATGSFASKTAGTNKTVTISGLTISGADSINYQLSQPSTTASISTKGLTITGLTANDKVYDQTTNATLSGTASLSGVISGDAVPLGGAASASFADKTVGTNKPVTVTGYSISGADSGNYSLSQPAGLTASITPAGLTVTGITANDRVYNHTTTASLNLAGAALNGVINGDTVNLNTNSATGAFANKNVGTNKTVSGNDASNYSLAQPTTTASISTANLTVIGITADNKAYDGTTNATIHTAGASLVGVFSGDNVTLNTASAVGYFADPNIGTNKTVYISGLALAGLDAPNYTVTQPTTTATIANNSLTVAGIAANNKVYDGTISATLNTNNAVLLGVQNGDQVGIIFTNATGEFDTKNVGTNKTVTIFGLILTGADAGKYALPDPTTNANITVAALTVTVSASNKVYDGNTTATVTLPDTRATGDDLPATFTNAAFADKNVASGKTVTVSGITISGTDAANYQLANTTASATASITSRPLLVSATGIDKTYDGNATATVTLSDNRVSGDSLTTTYTNA